MAMLYGSNGNNGDTKSASGGSAQYTGNYLNWYFGSSPTGWGTDARNKPGTQRRIDIAQGAASTLVSTLNNVRVGLASYNGEAGATINVGIDDIASNRTALTTAINALSPSGFTPLAESLYDIGRDFVGEANPQYDGPLVLHPDAASPITLDDDTVFDHSPTYAAGVALNGADLATAQRDELRKDAANNTENEATGMARLGYLRGDRGCELGATGTCSYSDGTNTFTSQSFRSREGLLGDIVQGNPLYVGPPVRRYPASWTDRLGGTAPENGGAQSPDGDSGGVPDAHAILFVLDVETGAELNLGVPPSGRKTWWQLR
jgi:hypothetical protein